MLCHPKPAKQKELPELPVGKWACRKPDCRQMFPTRNKLFAHLQEQLYFSKSIVPIYQVAPGVGPEIVTPSQKPHMGTEHKWACRQPQCQMTFPTRNKLFSHLRERLHFSKSIVPTYQITTGTTPVIVKPSPKPHMETGYAFRNFKFAEARIGLSASAEDQWADEGWFGDNCTEAHIAEMQTPIKVQGIVSESHTSTLYTVAKIIMPAVRKKEKVIMELVRSYVLAFPKCTRKRKVIKSGIRGRGRNRRMHYLVRWKGYMDQSSTNGHQLKKWSMWTT